ncbi:MAG: hypothetical protein ACOX57_06675 [Limnochordia bacterium]|jgi:hypothetical protein
MVRDSPILTGVLIGVLADAVKLGVNYLGYILGFTDVLFWQIVATNILPEQYLFTPSALLIGAIADLTVTAFLGVLFLYLIKLTGLDFLFLKGVGFAMLVWVGLLGSVLGPSIEAKLPQNPSGIFVTIAAHLAFGIALAVFTSFLYQPEET